MSRFSPQRLAASYGDLLSDILKPDAAAEGQEPFPATLNELVVQELWEIGLLGCEGETCRHGAVRILDAGVWNRGSGPDFLRAEIELDGRRLRGDIEIDLCASDWETLGRGTDADYDRVILHVVLSEPPASWFTRSSCHTEVPVLFLPPERVREVLDMPPPLDREMTPMCREPLAHMAAEEVEQLMLAAAAHRVECKRSRFRRQAAALGRAQAWFEAWAGVLGYSANKFNMVALARRAPLKILGEEAEAILFGTAGMLVPVLPESTAQEGRAYHRRLWDTWWRLSESFSLHRDHELPWVYAAQRPMNHPHRRIAALAVSARHWPQIEPLLNTADAGRLEALLMELRHEYWDYHYHLSSKPMSKRAALVGRERIRSFLVNYVYVLDESPGAWERYVKMGDSHPPKRVLHTAKSLFGDREDLAPLLRRHFAHQALLQIESDFCEASQCRDGCFPSQLGSWKPERGF